MRFFIDLAGAYVYYKDMKTLKFTLIATLILVLTGAVVLSCGDNIAFADSVDDIEVFVFDYDNNEFILTRKSTGDVVYRSAQYVINDIVGQIKGIVGEDGDYDIEIPAPVITVVNNGASEQDYSKENLFSFSASTSHTFDNVPLMSGYYPASSYEWTSARAGGAESKFVGSESTVSFGASFAQGEYKIFAYASVRLEIDGKVFTSVGKSEGVDIVINNGKVSVNSNLLKISGFVYGQTIENILNSANSSSMKTYKFELVDGEEGAISKDTILEVGKHGVLVYYVSGSWNGDVFIENESLERVKVTLEIEIVPREIRILVHDQTKREGDVPLDFDGWWEYISSFAPPAGVTTDDIGIEFWLEDVNGNVADGTTPGAYVIKGSHSNPNYSVLFLTEETAEKNDYSRWATLTVRKAVITASDDNFNYILTRNGGFDAGDELVVADGNNGGKTLKIYNDVASVEYDDLTLIIERKDESITSVMLYIDGQWTEVQFDDNGKITMSYSTVGDNASNFGIKLVEPTAPTTEPEEDKTLVIVLASLGILLGLFCCIGVPILGKYRKKKEDTPLDICDDTSVDPLKVGAKEENVAEESEKPVSEEKKEENIEENCSKEDESEEKAPLTLEDKYALHPEFNPTPSVEDAFKGVENDDAVEDEKESDESVEEGKITFKSKLLSASIENKAIYNALKNNLLSYKGVKSRVVNGGDYFRRPGKQLVKIIFIGKTMRLALALNPDDYDYNIYHQKNRGNMKKYADTPMFVKVQSLLGVRRAYKLIADLMEKEGVTALKESKYDDHIYNLTFDNDAE